MRPGGSAADPLVAPPLARRLACFLYEGVLLFGVVMVAGLLYAAVTEQRHALSGQRGLQAWLFVVLGVYFVGFWVWQGQTLAMRTWHLKLVGKDGALIGAGRATARYLLAWLWFVPALAALKASGLQGGLAFVAIIVIGVLTYGALSRLHPQRQFAHDVLCGTRLIDTRPAKA